MLTLLLAVAGCGGDNTPDQKGAVRSTVIQWLRAERDGDGATYCALMTPRSLRSQCGPRISSGRA